MNAWTANLLKVNHISKRVLRMLELIYPFKTILSALHEIQQRFDQPPWNFDAKLDLFNKQKKFRI